MSICANGNVKISLILIIMLLFKSFIPYLQSPLRNLISNDILY